VAYTKEGGITGMDFLKKLGETARSTASTIGAKSADLVEAGKIKLARSRLEGKIKDVKTDIGHIVYEAYRNGAEPDNAALQAKFGEIGKAESEIREIDEKLEQDRTKGSSQQAGTAPQQSAPASAAGFCPKCGAALAADARFCGNCGNPIA